MFIFEVLTRATRNIPIGETVIDQNALKAASPKTEAAYQDFVKKLSENEAEGYRLLGGQKQNELKKFFTSMVETHGMRASAASFYARSFLDADRTGFNAMNKEGTLYQSLLAQHDLKAADMEKMLFIAQALEAKGDGNYYNQKIEGYQNGRISVMGYLWVSLESNVDDKAHRELRAIAYKAVAKRSGATEADALLGKISKDMGAGKAVREASAWFTDYRDEYAALTGHTRKVGEEMAPTETVYCNLRKAGQEQEGAWFWTRQFEHKKSESGNTIAKGYWLTADEMNALVKAAWALEKDKYFASQINSRKEGNEVMSYVLVSLSAGERTRKNDQTGAFQAIYDISYEVIKKELGKKGADALFEKIPKGTQQMGY